MLLGLDKRLALAGLIEKAGRLPAINRLPFLFAADAGHSRESKVINRGVRAGFDVMEDRKRSHSKSHFLNVNNESHLQKERVSASELAYLLTCLQKRLLFA